MLTSTGLGQLRQSQNSIVTRNRLESDVAVPALLRRLPLVIGVQESVLIDLLGLLRADDTDFVVLATKATTGVANGMDVQLGGFRLARQLA